MHSRQLAGFYVVVMATSYLWQPRPLLRLIVLMRVLFIVAPPIVFSQADRADA